MRKLNSLGTMRVGKSTYRFHDLGTVATEMGIDLLRLPVSTRIFLENLVRHEDSDTVDPGNIRALATRNATAEAEFAFRPARIIMPDSSGVPLLADLASMREWIKARGGDPASINPLVPIDMVVDHSATVEHWGAPGAVARNLSAEYERNGERYRFLKWASQAFDRFTLFPPSSGIIHQINIEYLARPIRTHAAEDGEIAYPDTLIGMDSHTPMVNGLGVIGWGVGGIEATAVMLGEPIMMPLLPVIGCRFVGRLTPGVTSTDLALTVTEKLRAYGVVDAIVEFTGSGLHSVPVTDRCTIANMAAEYGANMGFFPIDALTLDYLRKTGRTTEEIMLAETYARRQGMWGSNDNIEFDGIVEIDLSSVVTSVAGPLKPQQRNSLQDVAQSFRDAFPEATPATDFHSESRALADGDIVIAAITSCTNTSNPGLLMAAGLVAQKALARGLKPKPWIKGSLSPGSLAAARYLAASGLQGALDAMGFNIVGFSCMTCAGQSGPLAAPVAEAIERDNLRVSAVLSSNRNFEGRIHPSVSAGYLASPPLVVAYALAGTVLVDLQNEPLGYDDKGAAVFLADLWPAPDEIEAVVGRFFTGDMFRDAYKNLAEGDETWRSIQAPISEHYDWDPDSSFICPPPFLDGVGAQARGISDIAGARVLMLLGDMVTTDHISPSGSIPEGSAAGSYLKETGISAHNLQSYIVRRVNHEVMLRGTFANTRLTNRLCPDHQGGYTKHMPSGDVKPIHEVAALYREAETPMVVVAGREYGMGSSRDWAAKGPHLLGVRAILAEGFERIHRANLVGMGILPLQMPEGRAATLRGTERFDIPGAAITECNQDLQCTIYHEDGRVEDIVVKCCIQTANELEWLAHGGILPFVGQRLLTASRKAYDA